MMWWENRVELRVHVLCQSLTGGDNGKEEERKKRKKGRERRMVWRKGKKRQKERRRDSLENSMLAYLRIYKHWEKDHSLLCWDDPLLCPLFSASTKSNCPDLLTLTQGLEFGRNFPCPGRWHLGWVLLFAHLLWPFFLNPTLSHHFINVAYRLPLSWEKWFGIAVQCFAGFLCTLWN